MHPGRNRLPIIQYLPTTVLYLCKELSIALCGPVCRDPAIAHVELVFLGVPQRREGEANCDRRVIMTLNDMDSDFISSLMNQSLNLHRTDLSLTRVGECLAESRAHTDAGVLVIDRHRLCVVGVPLVVERHAAIWLKTKAAHRQRPFTQKKLNPLPVFSLAVALDRKDSFALVAISELEPHIFDHVRLIRDE